MFVLLVGLFETLISYLEIYTISHKWKNIKRFAISEPTLFSFNFGLDYFKYIEYI